MTEYGHEILQEWAKKAPGCLLFGIPIEELTITELQGATVMLADLYKKQAETHWQELNMLSAAGKF